MDARRFETVLNILSRESVPDFEIFCIGEPFLNPDIYDIIAIALEHKETVSLLTNGSRVDVDKLAALGPGVRLYYSLDSNHYHAYAKYRGASRKQFEQAMVNLRRLKETDIDVFVSTLVMRHNEDHLDDIRDFVRDLGHSHTFSPFHCSSQGVTSEMLPDGYGEEDNHIGRGFTLPREHDTFAPVGKGKAWNRYALNPDLDLYEDIRELRTCGTGLSQPWVTTDGEVVPCCFFAYRPRFSFGNIFARQSFAQIWFSNEFNRFREGLLDVQNSANPACRLCACDSIPVPLELIPPDTPESAFWVSENGSGPYIFTDKSAARLKARLAKLPWASEADASRQNTALAYADFLIQHHPAATAVEYLKKLCTNEVNTSCLDKVVNRLGPLIMQYSAQPLAEWATLLRDNPALKDCQQTFAGHMVEAGFHVEAEEMLESPSPLPGVRAKTAYLMASICAETDRLEEAEKWLPLASDQEDSGALLRLRARIFKAKGLHGPAADVLRTTPPGEMTPSMLLDLAELEMASGNRAQAEQTLKKAREMEPSSHSVINALSLFLLDAGRNAEAIKILEQSLASEGHRNQREKMDMTVLLARSLETAEPDRAMSLYRDATAMEPENRYGALCRARFHLARGDVSGAHEFLKAGIEAHPLWLTDLELCKTMSSILSETGSRADFFDFLSTTHCDIGPILGKDYLLSPCTDALESKNVLLIRVAPWIDLESMLHFGRQARPHTTSLLTSATDTMPQLPTKLKAIHAMPEGMYIHETMKAKLPQAVIRNRYDSVVLIMHRQAPDYYKEAVKLAMSFDCPIYGFIPELLYSDKSRSHLIVLSQ